MQTSINVSCYVTSTSLGVLQLYVCCSVHLSNIVVAVDIYVKIGIPMEP